MRHGKKFNHLGRKAAHRKAMLSNMACSLIEHKRIKTTLAKAKSLRVYIEPLITKSKNDTTHSRRVVFSYLKQKEAITELFGDISTKIVDRPGGYTRIIRLGNRLGDNAQMAYIELVDYNEVYFTDKPKKKKTRRRGGGAKVESKSLDLVDNKNLDKLENSSKIEENSNDDSTTDEVKVELTETANFEEKIEEQPSKKIKKEKKEEETSQVEEKKEKETSQVEEKKEEKQQDNNSGNSSEAEKVD